MKKLSLNGKWKLSGCDNKDKEISLQASVPGTVHTALIEGGLIKDPFYGNNAEELSWIECKEWVYEREFDYNLTDSTKKLELEFKGLDTYCEIYLNNKKIADCNNMHRTYTFDVLEYVKSGINTLKIKFLPPVGKDAEMEPYLEQSGAFSDGRMYTRRMQCTYGWDWVNRFVTMGIWRDVAIYENRFVNIECLNVNLMGLSEYGAQLELYIKGKHDKRFFDGAFKKRRYHFETSPMVKFTVADPDGRVIYEKSKLFREAITTDYLTVEKPRLWYPNGYGESPLYTLTAEVIGDNSELITSKTITFGIRDVQIIQRYDKVGEDTYKTAEEMYNALIKVPKGENEFASFELIVNGVRVICKGANWVPADPFPGNVTSDKYKALLKLAKDGNMNMLRIWGGGIFEDDEFYNLCDRYGIMLQQDMLMACGVYPYSDEYIESPNSDAEAFLENIAAEIDQNVQRLVHHPSLVWWNGDNENQSAGNENLINNARRISNEVTAPIIRKYDKSRRFFTSTPWGGSHYNSPSNGLFHGTGYLGWYFDCIKETDMSGYAEKFAAMKSRFANETPVLSGVTESSMKKFIAPEDMTKDSFDGYIYHTKNHPDKKYAEFGLFHHIDMGARKIFGEFKSASDRIYKMCILGYEWIRVIMEETRRDEAYTTGMIFWMYNDCWPALGWSMVDYYGTPKAAYYAMARTSAPLTSSITSDGNTLFVNLSNDSRQPLTADIELKKVNGDGTVYSENMTAEVGAGESVRLAPDCAENFMADDKSVVLCDVNSSIGTDRSFYISCLPSRLKLDSANITSERGTDAEGEYIILRADKLAMFVWLDGDYAFSDNCFIMCAGEEKKVYMKNSYDRSSEEIKICLLNPR